MNRLAGAHTQLSTLVTAGATLLTLVLLAKPMGLMPQATLAAVVIVYSVGLISLEGFRSILAVRRTEFLWAVVALAGVLLLGTLKGILVAIVVSVVALGQQVANPPVYSLRRKPGTNVFRPVSDEHPEDETFPGLLILRPEGRIFFLNASRIGERLQRLVDESNAKVVVLDLSGVFDLEYSALVAFVEAEKRLREHGVTAWLAGLNPGVLEVVQRSELGRTLGRERMHFNLEIAVREYLRAQGEEPSEGGAGRLAQGSARAPGAGA
jgi:MFS superfamily sulfate permease-like transporter